MLNTFHSLMILRTEGPESTANATGLYLGCTHSESWLGQSPSRHILFMILLSPLVQMTE